MGIGCMSARRQRSPKPRPGSSTKVPDAGRTAPAALHHPALGAVPLHARERRAQWRSAGAGRRQARRAELPRAIIYLPTRRAVRALRDAFLDASGGQAALLPSIRRARRSRRGRRDHLRRRRRCRDQGFAGAGGARAIGPLERRLALMRLVLAWSKRLHESGKAEPRPGRAAGRNPGAGLLPLRRTSATSWTSSKARRSASPR